ncbi:hypothetical protein [Staphylococcus succinus]|uniref:hypothetical protein n=1 Tax=Staphylococcus succinus TaxID=61015 RepID=UPI001C03F374|nr:hypothetical protein [Staphylococcus succinus]MBU0439351.1 hypothetical protein [Staphylococcus succinus]
MKTNLMNWLSTLSIVGVLSLLSNWIGYDVMPSESLPGVIILIIIAIIGLILHSIIPLNVPSIAYIGIIALVLTIPGIPGSNYIVEYTEKVNLLSLTTPVLAYAGISIGNSWLDFAKLGWKTIVVGIVVLIGTYLGSAVIAEIVLRIQGVI